jgi:hypothetical protein
MDNPTCNLCGSEKVSLTLTCHEPACVAKQHPSPHVPAPGPQTLPFPHAWQNRVVEEKAELDERRLKLEKFIGCSTREEIDAMGTEAYMLLMRQAHVMRRLSEVLQARIELFRQ